MAKPCRCRGRARRGGTAHSLQSCLLSCGPAQHPFPTCGRAAALFPSCFSDDPSRRWLLVRFQALSPTWEGAAVGGTGLAWRWAPMPGWAQQHNPADHHHRCGALGCCSHGTPTCSCTFCMDLLPKAMGCRERGGPTSIPPPRTPQGSDRLHQPRKPFLSPRLTTLHCFLLPRWLLPVIAGKVTSKLGK